MNDTTFDADDPPAKPKGKGGRKWKKAERAEVVRSVARLVRRWVEPADVVDWVVKTYAVHPRTGWTLLAEARRYVAAR